VKNLCFVTASGGGEWKQRCTIFVPHSWYFVQFFKGLKTATTWIFERQNVLAPLLNLQWF